jgi:hypothetical protein
MEPRGVIGSYDPKTRRYYGLHLGHARAGQGDLPAAQLAVAKPWLGSSTSNTFGSLTSAPANGQHLLLAGRELSADFRYALNAGNTPNKWETGQLRAGRRSAKQGYSRRR